MYHKKPDKQNMSLLEWNRKKSSNHGSTDLVNTIFGIGTDSSNNEHVNSYPNVEKVKNSTTTHKPQKTKEKSNITEMEMPKMTDKEVIEKLQEERDQYKDRALKLSERIMDKVDDESQHRLQKLQYRTMMQLIEIIQDRIDDLK